ILGVPGHDIKGSRNKQEVRMKDLLKQQGLPAALKELPAATIVAYDNVIRKKAFSALILCLGDRSYGRSPRTRLQWGFEKKLETLYMTKSLANRLYLKKKLYTFHMHPGKSLSEHTDELHKLVGDLAAIEIAISNKDQVLLLLTSLPSSYDNFVETLLYGRDTLKLEDVLATLNFRELQKMTEAKGDGGKGLYVRGRSGRRDMEQGTESVYNHKKSQGFVMNEDYVSGSRADGECRVWGTGKDRVQKRDGSSFILYNVSYVSKLKRNLILLRTLEKEGFTVKMQSGRIKVIKGLLLVLSGTKRVNCLYTLDGKAVTKRTLKGRKQLREYQTGWKIKTVLYKNIGFNESGEYKKMFVGSSVHTGSVHVLQGVKFEVEPLKDHTFEVEPYGNVDHVVGSHEVQTNYREDSIEAAFAVVTVYKIYAHESLAFNNIGACEVISKWKAGLKDDTDARSDVYVLSNGCKKCSDDSDGYYWKYTPYKAKGNELGMEIVRDQSGNTLRVSQSKFYNGKLVNNFWEEHFILSLEGSLSRDCDVEKNAEAGYMTLTEAVKGAIWLKGLAIKSGFELKIVAGIAT
nr:retrovirus-related Pol polyprotein from transposon TNT 1-94 [Tanacetum cinerariifolium]